MSSPAPRPAARQEQPLPGDVPGLERVIRGQQNQLASSVDALLERVAPKNVAERAKADATARARGAVYTSSGDLRVERVLATGSSVLALVGLVLWRRGRKKARRRQQRRYGRAA